MGLGDDTCRVRSGEAAEILAAIRDAGLRPMRAAGLIEIAASLRLHAANPDEARRLVMSLVPS